MFKYLISMEKIAIMRNSMPADSRALALIYLIENELVTIEQINASLK